MICKIKVVHADCEADQRTEKKNIAKGDLAANIYHHFGLLLS